MSRFVRRPDDEPRDDEIWGRIIAEHSTQNEMIRWQQAQERDLKDLERNNSTVREYLEIQRTLRGVQNILANRALEHHHFGFTTPHTTPSSRRRLRDLFEAFVCTAPSGHPQRDGWPFPRTGCSWLAKLRRGSCGGLFC